MAKQTPMLKNTATTIYVELRAQADPTTFKSGPTLAAGDVKFSLDGGAYANLNTLPTAAGTIITVTLLAAETNGDCVKIKFEDVAGAEWVGRVLTFYTDSQQIGSLSTLGGTAQSGDTYALANSGTFGFAVLARRADLPANLSALAITAGGIIDVSLKWILGSALTETAAGYLTAAFKKFFNVAAPTSTMNQLTLVDTATSTTNAPTAGDLTATMKASVTAAVPTAATIAAAVEAAMLDETDGRAIQAAIVAKLNATDTNLAGLTLAAIAQAVRDVALAGAAANSLGAGVTTVMTTGAIEANEITRANALSAKLDTLLTRNNALDANGIRAAVGLAIANLDTQLAAIAAKTTNLPSDPADASDIAAAFAGIAATVRAQADAALAAYDAPTHAEMTAELATADDAVLASLAGGVNVTRINGVVLAGAGTEASPMRPA